MSHHDGIDTVAARELLGADAWAECDEFPVSRAWLARAVLELDALRELRDRGLRAPPVLDLVPARLPGIGHNGGPPLELAA